jgi:hypothetical protein
MALRDKAKAARWMQRFLAEIIKHFLFFNLTAWLIYRNHFVLPHMFLKACEMFCAGCVTHAQYQVIFDR